MNLRLGGSCQFPIAGYCTESADRWHLQALVGDRDGREILRADGFADAAGRDALGTQVAEDLLARGADRLLAG